MSADSHLVLYITANKIYVASFIGKEEKIYELEWDGTDPTEVFSYIKKTYKSSQLKIILGYEFSYVVCFEVDSDKINRVGILSAAKQVVPEDLADYDCYWYVFAQNEEKKTSAVALVAVVPKLLNALAFAAKKNKLTITHITPIELVLAQVTKDDDMPRLVVWGDIEKVALVAYKGNVYVSEDITYRTDKKITELVTFAHQTYNLKIATAIVDWQKKDKPEINKEPTFSMQWKIVLKQLNPLLQMYEHEVGVVDENALRVVLPKDPIPPTTETEIADVPIPVGTDTEKDEEDAGLISSIEINPHEEKSYLEDSSEEVQITTGNKSVIKSINKKMLIIIGVVFILTLVGIGALSGFNTSEQKAIPSPTPTPSVSPEPSVSPNLSVLKVQVLNGSGVTGAAKEIAQKLEALEFQTVETGNADANDYTKTQIQMKSSVSESVYEQITKELNEYVTEKGDALADSSSFDIVVTLGSEKK